MEPMVFSYAYYNVNDFQRIMAVFNMMQDKGLFLVDKEDMAKEEMIGSFIQSYPKNHWNPLAGPNAKQVLGSAEIKNHILKIETHSKNGLKKMRGLLEQMLGESIAFQKEEFKDVMDMLKKQ